MGTRITFRRLSGSEEGPGKEVNKDGRKKLELQWNCVGGGFMLRLLQEKKNCALFYLIKLSLNVYDYHLVENCIFISLNFNMKTVMQTLFIAFVSFLEINQTSRNHKHV